eukprot:CAMPEP_0185781190 /NCGR_PEP_ID=MMETSP1174-20130828/101469_1 /TAXON_ID=35687 /ORGANISM="Dictyocha speculum, Strain CCMP1381" /LENGTH=71 /DNA_ID=CAMNT_0028471065 /DNA_START=602 /DNA_END=817 /DNA_ORIENTATION=+
MTLVLEVVEKLHDVFLVILLIQQAHDAYLNPGLIRVGRLVFDNLDGNYLLGLHDLASEYLSEGALSEEINH